MREYSCRTDPGKQTGWLDEGFCKVMGTVAPPPTSDSHPSSRLPTTPVPSLFETSKV